MDACSEIMTATNDNEEEGMTMSRKEKRKLLKKEKRKQIRKEIAVKEKQEEEARLNDVEEQRKLRQLEKEELERMEMDRREFEERERRFLEALELNRKREQEEYEQEQARQELAEKYRTKQVEVENPEELDGGSDWEYVEDGPAEIIWQGNEIIVKKKRVRIPKKNLEQNKPEDVARPTSNPLAPEHEAFEDYKSAQQILDTVSQQVPNFGTEQDKAHCPFHLKTGACRFGTRCSRVHFYPDKSCTLLMKNMYSGPGLVWEQEEGLEHTDEEIERSFEEFYEDVHTEFLKFGEIVNFKVCRNGSPHLRGNAYVHYKSLESAMLAYRSTNGRYFAGKQVGCEFVNLTRWKVAICGEYMKSRFKTCSRGTSCNFIHCFRNPGGDYEWADWDRAPPRYWVKKMVALFGYEDGYDKQLDEESPDKSRSTLKRISMDTDRRRLRSRSRELDNRHARSYDDGHDYRMSNGKKRRHTPEGRGNSLDRDRNEQKMRSKENDYLRDRSSDDDQSDREVRNIYYEEYSSHRKSHGKSRHHSKHRNPETDSDIDYSDKDRKERYHKEGRSRRSKRLSDGKSDSGKERSVKDERERYHQDDRTTCWQKASDSVEDFRGEGRRNDKQDIYRSENGKGEDNDVGFCSSDSHGNTLVKSQEGYDLKRKKKSSQRVELDCSDHDLRGDGFDGDGYRKESEKRDSGRRIKRVESRHNLRHGSKHRAESGSERIHKRRKNSSWDQNQVDDEFVATDEKQEGGESGGGSGQVESEERACRRAALEKLRGKQLKKQPASETGGHNMEGLAVSEVNDDEAETRRRPRI